MLLRHLLTLLFALSLPAVHDQDHSVEKIDGRPEAGDVADDLLDQLADSGLRVKRGSSRTVCELWLCKEWPVDAEFKPTPERLYPFKPGQLIGVLRFRRRGSDFRDQNIGRGWYTLRFGLQPVDGNHEGTSPTRDFLVMVGADQDTANKSWDMRKLLEASAEAAGSTHPGLLCLQKATDGADTVMRHDETNDWWILHTVGTGAAEEKTQQIPLDLIVVGHATE